MLTPGPRWFSLLLGMLVMPVITACDWPRDPEGTLNNVRGGVLRVGVIHQPPWVLLDPAGGPPRGPEVQRTLAIAQSLGAELRWQPGGETHLMRALKKFELDLVIGGLTTDSPYGHEVGFTRPYHRDRDGEHVFAAPPGENGWISTLEGLLGEPGAAP